MATKENTIYLKWKCPSCATLMSDYQDPEQGPFYSVICDDCGACYSFDQVPNLERAEVQL